MLVCNTKCVYVAIAENAIRVIELPNQILIDGALFILAAFICCLAFIQSGRVLLLSFFVISNRVALFADSSGNCTF